VTLLDRYGSVLRGTDAAGPLLASIVGRLPLGMTGLGILLLVRASTGSYASAGLVSAAYALSFAVVNPLRARAADRRGPVRVLVVTGVLHPVALLALVLLAAASAPTPALALAAVAVGGTVPPLGAVMRALWGRLVDGPRAVTAYALESVVIEISFVVGPLLVGGLSAAVGPAAAVVASAVLTLVGTAGMVRTRALRAATPTPGSAHVLGPLTAAPVRALLLCTLAIGTGFGALEVAMPAFAEDAGGRRAAAGVLLAVWSAGSMAGGLLYGAVHSPLPHRRQLPWLVVALAVGSALPLALGPVMDLTVLGAALFCYGLTIAPLGACMSVLLSASAPAGTVTEAFAWNSSMIFGGAALGTSVGGVLVDRHGAAPALALTAATGVAVLALGLRAVRRQPVTA
jgi:predicted MFS family arabinose efflux permease